MVVVDGVENKRTREKRSPRIFAWWWWLHSSQIERTKGRRKKKIRRECLGRNRLHTWKPPCFSLLLLLLLLSLVFREPRNYNNSPTGLTVSNVSKYDGLDELVTRGPYTQDIPMNKYSKATTTWLLLLLPIYLFPSSQHPDPTRQVLSWRHPSPNGLMAWDSHCVNRIQSNGTWIGIKLDRYTCVQRLFLSSTALLSFLITQKRNDCHYQKGSKFSGLEIQLFLETRRRHKWWQLWEKKKKKKKKKGFFFFFFLYIWRGRWRLTRNAAPSFFFLTTLWPVWTQKPLFPRGFLGEMTSHPLVVQPHESRRRKKKGSSSSSSPFFNPAPPGRTVCARSVNSVSFQSATGGLQKMSSALFLFLEQKE